MNTHHAANIVIKRADVDVDMIPLVNYLNSFESVTTLACCQGENGETEDDVVSLPGQRPYVLWTCTDTIDLIKILKKLEHYGVTEIMWNNGKRHFEYRTAFPNKQILIKLRFDSVPV